VEFYVFLEGNKMDKAFDILGIAGKRRRIAELREKLKISAEQNGRSMSAHVIMVLEEYTKDIELPKETMDLLEQQEQK
jgi:hypothetical protein